MKKLIIFDLDNTLYDYDKINDKCYKIVIDNIIEKTCKSREIINNVIEQAKLKLKRKLGNTASSHSRILYFQNICEELNLELSFALYLNEIYWNNFYKLLKPYHGVKYFFNYLKENNIKIGILTNFTAEHQYKKLKHLELLDYINCLVTSEEVGIEKPNEDMFNTIIKKTKFKTNDILMIGDSFDNDIIGSIQSNIYSGYLNKSNSIGKKYFSFSSFKNLYVLISQLNFSINNLVSLCKKYGQRFDLTQAGGGNISVKLKFEDETISIIKASGYSLSDVSKYDGYTIFKNDPIKKYVNNLIFNKKKSELEKDTKNFIKKNILFNCDYRPSIETPMHSLFYKYTVHLHPIQCNLILTKKNSREIINSLFNNSLIIDYYTPGIELSKNIQLKYSNEKIIFLLNHGIIVTSDSLEEIDIIITRVLNKIENYLSLNFDKYKIVNKISSIYELIYNNRYITYLIEDEIIKKHIDSIDILNNVSIPDKLVYCGNNVINLIEIDNLNNILYGTKNKPKLILYNKNLYVVSHSLKKCKDIVDVLKSHLIISSIDDKLLENLEIDYLNNWEAEKYRQNL
jgi:HAD superfamily hydrolase (TIGR01549 family)